MQVLAHHALVRPWDLALSLIVFASLEEDAGVMVVAKHTSAFQFFKMPMLEFTVYQRRKCSE